MTTNNAHDHPNPLGQLTFWSSMVVLAFSLSRWLM